MPLETFQPFLWIERIIAVAIIFQTIELFQIRATFADNGIWSWHTIRREFSSYAKMFRWSLDFCLAYKNFLLLLTVRLFAAVLLLLHSHVLLAPILFVTTLLICLRWRGTFNGGSDYMTIIVLLVLSIAKCFQDYPAVVLGCLWYLAIQASLSYFVAGVAKLKHKNWRSGVALPGFLGSAVYRAPNVAIAAGRSPLLMLVSSWLIILFELSFPAALFQQQVAVVFIASAFIFHLLNCYVFGLNRFLFAWAATYPAVYFCSLV